jgi:sulfate adenylyltransferase subunit 2
VTTVNIATDYRTAVLSEPGPKPRAQSQAPTPGPKPKALSQEPTTGLKPRVLSPEPTPTREPDTREHLRLLEAESIQIIREVAAEFARPVMLYSIGKDSSVLLRLAQKAFHPAPIPFPLLHIDTTYKFREMIEFRDWYAAQVGIRLIVHTNEDAIAEGTQPFAIGTQRCCGLLKTKALLDALERGGFDAAFGGARRDEERSRAKERIFSFRDAKGQWDPKRQRPELWQLLNGRVGPGESIRVFPLSNWTELDVWHYIDVERIPVVPMYFAREREVIVRGNGLLLLEQPFVPLLPGERPQIVRCRMRSLGCSPCTGAVRSDADTVPKIIDELVSIRHSERQLRVIDHDQDGSMELKKREGYF